MFIFSCELIRSLELSIANLFKHIATKTKYGPLVVAMSPIVIFATICFAWAYKGRAWKRKKKVPRSRVLRRSMSIGSLHGGKLALKRLVDYHDARADVTLLDAAEPELVASLAHKYPNFKKLQRTLGKLEMSGKEAQAVDVLKRERINARKEGKSCEAYEIEMLLVEMLIYKGDFEEALKCKCLDDEKITDARRPLFKAIIYILLDHRNEEAKNCWEDFKEIQKQFQWEPSLQDGRLHEATKDFKKFEKVVKLLKDDIRKAREYTRK